MRHKNPVLGGQLPLNFSNFSSERTEGSSVAPHYFFFFFAAAFFGTDFLACACTTGFVAFFPGRFEVFTSAACAGFTFFSFFTSSGALYFCPSKPISVIRTACLLYTSD